MAYRNKITGEVISDQEYQERVGGTPRTSIDALRAEAATAEQEASIPTSRRFLGELPGQAAKQLIQQPARFIASAAIAPVDIARGVMGKEPLDTNIPGIGQTFQRQASERIAPVYEKAYAGEPLRAGDYAQALRLFAEVPLAAVEAVGIGKLAKGGATGAKGLFSQRAENRAVKGVTEELVPRLTPTRYVAAGRAGSLTAPTSRRAGGVSPNSPDVQEAYAGVKNVADDLGVKITDIVKPKATVTANMNKVNETIGTYSQNVVRPFLNQNKVDTNFEDFIRYINEVRPERAIKESPDAFAAFNRVRERVIEDVYRSVKSQSKAAGEFGANTDPAIFWNARKALDNAIAEELGAKTLTDVGATGVKSAAKALRRGTADYISDMLRFPGQTEKLATYRNAVNGLRDRGFDLSKMEYMGLEAQMGLSPVGTSAAKQWETYMKNLEGLYKASDNLLTKVSGEQGKTLWALWSKRHPFTATTVKGSVWGAGVIGAGAGAYHVLRGE